jgi:hypothetical protein
MYATQWIQTPVGSAARVAVSHTGDANSLGIEDTGDVRHSVDTDSCRKRG